MSQPLMTDKELMGRLRLKKSAFYAHKAAGHLDRFMVRNPIGQACWSRKLVDLHCDGESTVVLGGRRGLRRAS